VSEPGNGREGLDRLRQLGKAGPGAGGLEHARDGWPGLRPRRAGRRA
jgi:hypothetical protein